MLQSSKQDYSLQQHSIPVTM